MTDGGNPRGIPPGIIPMSKVTGGIQADGQSQIHVSNNITVIHGQSKADSSSDWRDNDQSVVKNRRRELLQSLRFEQIDTRHDTIRRAHSRSCRWLLSHQTYLDWLDDEKLGQHYGVLWIRGKPGAGKSTLMKFALKQSGRSRNSTSISFFFHARGSDLEKSTVGMYRSLLLQLLERIPELQSVFDSLGPTTWKGSGHQWSEESLKDLFEEAIDSLGRASLVCFIDALDECDEIRIRDMLSFMLQIGESAAEAGTRFRVCFSSRHFPSITINRPLSMDLERQAAHGQDIERYIASELRIGTSGVAWQIKGELRTKASGVFMWVVLVVDILNRVHDGGNVHELQKKLREIPGDLQGLFHDVMTRDGHKKDRLLLCVQWLLFARHPLSPRMLYLVILGETDINTALNWNPNEVTDDDVERCILDTSKGLTEVTTSGRPTVQFIHESVRDFFLMSDGLSHIWPDLNSTNFACQSQERIKQCCFTYIRAGNFNHSHDDETDYVGHLRDPKSYRERARPNLLLEYAIPNILYHAEEAEKDGSDQTTFLESFPQGSWIHDLFLFRLSEFDRTVNYIRNKRYTPEASFLYVLATHNLAALIKRYPANHTGFEIEDQQYGAPILAALAYGNNAAALAMVNRKIAAEPSDPLLHDVCNRFREKIHDRPANINIAADNYSVIVNLAYIARFGDPILFEFFRAVHKCEIDEKNWYGRTPLSYACQSTQDGRALLVRHLLDSGAEADSRDRYGRTPLSYASTSGHRDIVRYLLDSAAEVDSRDKDGRTPLSHASESGPGDIIRHLLDNGAEVDSRDKDGRTPLSHAVTIWRTSTERVKFLLDSGAEVNSRDQNGWTALEYALGGENDDAARLLLERGAANPMDFPLMELLQIRQTDSATSTDLESDGSLD